ncbi:MAG: acetate--CoA ligase family protein, partial [Pseudomonadota bacterium]
DGVAILTQSSNIAINLTMQRRDLPVAFVVTCGNMAQTAQAEIAMALLDDPRVTAIGLHVEGFGDPLVWHALALKAAERNVPLIALKVGASDQARSATLSHTASLAGSDAGAAALLQYLGIARVSDLSTFLEALMLLHCDGPLPSTRIASISCSGGEASLVADMAQTAGLDLPALTGGQRRDLEAALGPMVAVANPLDYHTYIWGDVAKMTAGWLPMAQGDADLVMIVVDYPHTDASAWVSATDAAIAVRAQSDCAVAVVASLPELLPPDVARRLRGAGVTPLHGLYEALGAVRAVAQVSAPAAAPPLMPAANGLTDVVSEADAKAGLGAFGVPVPQGCVASRAALAQSAEALDGPLVLKGMGFAHKSEAGAVVLKLTHDTLATAAEKMGGDIFLIEEMVQGSVAELLVGVLRDPAHGYLLTLGAGGVMTELLHDTQCLLLPVTQEQVARALAGLRCYPLLTGFRGASPARIDAIISAVMALQDYVIAHQDRLYEVEINPLICTADEAVAADALIVQLAEAKQKGVAHGTG